MAMNNLADISGGKLMLMCGDKAYNHEAELSGLRDPHVAIHGSFSFMVNFHAVKLYVDSRGGFALQTPYLDGFKCCNFVLGFDKATLPELRYAWSDCMDNFGPDNFSTLQRCIKDETLAPTPKLALSTIRMAHYDSDVFYKFKQALIDRAPYMSEKQQADLRRDILMVYECYYPLQRTRDVAFEVGRLFMGLKAYNEAVNFFQVRCLVARCLCAGRVFAALCVSVCLCTSSLLRFTIHFVPLGPRTRKSTAGNTMCRGTTWAFASTTPTNWKSRWRVSCGPWKSGQTTCVPRCGCCGPGSCCPCRGSWLCR